MLTGELQHPEILAALAAAGHNSRVLICDGNYPFRSHVSPSADLVFLNFAPGKLGAVEVLEVLARAIPIQDAAVNMPAEGSAPAIHAEFRRVLAGVPVTELSAQAFYERAMGPEVVLLIATGEPSHYACVCLTIGYQPNGWLPA